MQANDITLNISGAMAKAITDLANQEGVGIKEVVRRAIGTESFLRAEQEKGGRIYIEHGNKLREVVLR